MNNSNETDIWQEPQLRNLNHEDLSISAKTDVRYCSGALLETTFLSLKKEEKKVF